jgi:hypothetical protein
MKLRKSSHGKSVLAVGLSLGLMGCDDGSNFGGLLPEPMLAQIGEGYPLATEDAPPTIPADAETQLKPAVVPAPPRLSPAAEEVVQLAQAQVGEEVLLAYIENTPAVFGLKAGDILYLHDLGISAPVIAAMIRHDESLRTPEWESATETPGDATAEAPPAAVEGEPSTAVAVSTAPASDAPVTQNYFYTSLAPYGTWVDLPEYGWCWRPTVAVVDPGWRPYLHGGRWVYSDCGWYWHSYYSWGWAPFHYGRWHLGTGYGWVWVPDTHWGPAWVTWRYGGGYYGWAPLPPGAVYASGIGLTYYGSSVSFSFGFGYSSSYYCFVPVGSFCSYRPWNHCVPYGHAGQVYNNSTVINNYVQGDGNNTVINVGPGSDAVASASRTEIQKVKVRDLAPGESRLVRADSLSRDGTTLNVYRPRLPEQASTPPAEITRGQQEVQRRARELVASESAQAAVVKARSTDRVLSAGAASSRSAGPTSTPRVVGNNTTSSRMQPNRNPVAPSTGGTTAPVARSEPQRAPTVSGRSEVSRSRSSAVTSPPRAVGSTVVPQQTIPRQRPAQPTTTPAWSRPTPRIEPVRPAQGSVAPAVVPNRNQSPRTVNPAYSITPRPSPQPTPRTSTGVPSFAPRTPLTGASAPAPQPAVRRAPPTTRSFAPAPSRAPAPSVVPSRPSVGAMAPARGMSPSPARPAGAPSPAPRSSSGNRGR